MALLRALVVACAALTSAVASHDGTGNGVSKSTYAATDPVRLDLDAPTRRAGLGLFVIIKKVH